MLKGYGEMAVSLIAQIVLNGLLLGGIYALASIGLNIIYGVMDFINFAHGEFLMLGMYLSYVFWSLFGINPLISILPCFLFSFLVGWLLQSGIIDRALKSSNPALTIVCVTFGLSIVLKGFALMFFGASYLSIKVPYISASVNILGLRCGLPQLLSFISAIITTLLVFLLFIKTDLGIAVRATMDHKTAATLCGINPELMYRFSFALGISCATLAGVFLSMFYYIFPEIGTSFAATCFAVVVLGGLGSFNGAFYGGLIIGVTEPLGGFLISPSLKQVVSFAIFIIVLLLKPTGLFSGK